MTGASGFVVLGLLWAAVAYRTWDLFNAPRSRLRVALWVVILALALAATFFHPAVYRAFDEAVGVPNLAELVGHALILTSAWQGQGILTFLIHPKLSARRRMHVHGGLVVASVTVMAVFFTLAPVDQEAPQTFTSIYAGAPWIVPYWLTFLVTVNYLLADIVRLVARYGSRTEKEHLRLGLHLVAVGGAVAVAYWIHWSTYLLLRQAGLAIPSWLRGVGVACMFGAVLFVVVGSTVPALGPRTKLPTPYARLSAHRDYRQLHPLWRVLANAAPEVVLQRPPRLVLDIRFWLNRRIVEIEDALRALSSDAPHAGGQADPAEAALIRQIVSEHRVGMEVPPPDRSDQTAAQLATDSYTDRLRWHLDVARAYARGDRRASPATVRRLTPESRKEVNTT